MRRVHSVTDLERGVRDYAAMSVADQSTVQMMMIVADSFCMKNA